MVDNDSDVLVILPATSLIDTDVDLSRLRLEARKDNYDKKKGEM